MRVESIGSLDRPELAPYRTMRRQLEHRKQGIFVAEGEKVVRRLLESRFVVESLLLPEKWFQDYESLIRARPEEIRVYLAEKKVLETLTGFSMFQGVLAIGRIPAQPTLETILERSRRPRLLVAIEGLSNAENVGAVARNCAAFAVGGLIAGKTSSSPFLRRAIRSSMGAVFRLPVLEDTELIQTISALRAYGVRCIAAHPHTDKRTLRQANLSTDCCIVFGSEGSGLSDEVLRVCDETVAIPMGPGVDSLNVGSATAVFLYEARRQRNGF